MKREDKPIILLNKSKILLQTFRDNYRQAYNLLVEISEPLSRPVFVHQFQFTIESLIKAMTLGYDYNRIVKEISKYMQNEEIPSQMCRYIKDNTQKFGCARLELKEVTSTYGSKLAHVLEIDSEIYSSMGGLSGIQKEIFSEYNFTSKKLILEDDYTVATRQLNQHKIPVIFQHRYQTQDFEQEEQLPKLSSFEIQLKPFAQLRYYQQDSLKAIFEGENKAKSGIIILPCGAGKTLLGIAIAVRIKKSALIICNGDASVQQWKAQFLKWTSGLDPKKIIKLTGKSHSQEIFRKKHEPFIVITSYPYLNSKLNKNDKPGHDHRIKNVLWGLCILDQVQCLPAKQYKQIIHKFKAHVKIGLTATPYRQDQRFNSLDYLIGPTLYQANWLDFIKEGHLANPYCVEVRIPYREPLPDSYQTDHRKKILVENPLKFKTLKYLLKVHQDKGDFIIVFCDYVPLIQYYARVFRRPVVSGQTPEEDRRFIFDMFRRRHPRFQTVFLCRVGDQGIDLPNASVGIQLTMFGRSRKQVVQRLGRIMRPKDSSSKGYNSFFYTFVSNIPMEMQYFYTRQKCLGNLGFPHGIIKQEDLPYNDPNKHQSRWFGEKETRQISDFIEWVRKQQQKQKKKQQKFPK